MAQRTTLTQRQIDVLRWIAYGCVDAAIDNEHYSARITAAALRNRGLVRTCGSGASWSASITNAGTAYLAQVDGADPPIPREPNLSVSQRLIREIVAAGGSLRVRRRSSYGDTRTPDYERRVARAVRCGAVPPGKRLVVARERDALCIVLCDAPEGTPTELLPVPVPERVRHYDRVVSDFRAHADRHEVSPAELPRVCRILQGLVVEAQRRGYVVEGPSTTPVREYGKPEWSGDRDGHLRVTVGDCTIVLRIREDGRRARATYGRTHEPYQMRDVDRARSSERRATGTLRISILSPYSAWRPSSWGDGKRQTLEELLPHVLIEIGARAAEERERRDIARAEDEQRRRAWEHAKENANRRYVEHERGRVLDMQIVAWQRATAIRAYTDAIERRYGHDENARTWAAWARVHADSIDPLMTPPRTPDPPAAVSLEDLRPFLDGWSPYAAECDRSY